MVGVPQKGFPMLSIACNWIIYRDYIAKNRDVPYVTAIQKFKEIIGNDVTTKEVINVDYAFLFVKCILYFVLVFCFRMVIALWILISDKL